MANFRLNEVLGKCALLGICFISLLRFPQTGAVNDSQWIWEESRSSAVGTNITLWWAFGLNAGETFSRAQVTFVQSGTIVQNQVALIVDNGGKQIDAKYQSRADITREGQNVSVILTSITLSDDGAYSCRVETSKDLLGKNKETAFEITASPVIDPKNKTVIIVNESQPFSLSCMASGKPTPIVVWNKTSGSPLQFPDGTTLNVSSASSEHNGTYQCTATNKAGSDTAIFVVIVQYKPNGVTIVPSSKNIIVNETGSITLTCQAFDGNPDVYWYKWQYNGVDLPGEEDSRLELINVNRSQSGNYTCIASNIIGMVNNSTLLTVQGKPNSVQISPHPSVTVNEMDNTTLECNVSGGNPAVYHYKWQHNGDDISRGENGRLTLIDIKRKQNGSYSCQGCNTIGCISSSTSLIVQYQPFNVSIVADTDSTVAVGKSLTLICTFDSGNLPASVEWKFNDTSLQQETNRTLVIQKVNVSDSGTYKCTAINILGNTTGEMVITVTPEECVEKSCSGNGECTIQSDGVKKCKCKEGWHGENCNTCTCKPEGTVNGGCDVIDGQRICQCKDKYSGDLCELRSDEYDIVTGRFALTDYPYEDWMKDIKSNQAKQFIAMFRPLLQSGTSAKGCKITELTKGSVEIHFELFFEKGEKDKKKEAVKNFIKGGKLGNYTIKEGSLVIEDPNISGNDGESKLSTEAIIIIVLVVVALVIAIIALIMWRVQKDRCKRKRKAVGNGEEHQLCERNLSNPNVGYHNSGLEHAPYVEDGPTVTAHQNERTKNGNNPNDLYAKVDMSKKTNKKKMPTETKKKKPGEVLYADLADFQPNVVTEGSKAEQPVKKPEKYQSTDYASITDIIKEREGKSIKVPIAASHIPNNDTTGTTKVVNGVGDGAVVAAEPVKDGESVKDPVEVPDPNIPKNGSTGATKVVNGVGDGTVVAPEPEKAIAGGTETVGDSSNLLNRKDDVEEGNQRKAEDILPQVA